MSSHRNSHAHGFKITTMIASAITICIIAALLVTTGAWDRFAASIPWLKTTGASISALMPGEDDSRKLGLHATIPTPQASADNTGPAGGQQPQATPDTGSTADSKLPAAANAGISIATALDWAKQTPVATPHPEGYDRETQFGGWANSSQLCGTGTTRDSILKRDLTDVQMNSRCQVTSGTLVDPYTGKTIEFTRGKDTSGDIQIDHVVALHDAYASGLWKASRATRVKYANDPDVLLASQGAANNTKSDGVNVYRAGKSRQQWEDSTPSVWLPSNTAYQCEYMAKRVNIKHQYDLTMSSWEKDETINFLTQCAAQ